MLDVLDQPRDTSVITGLDSPRPSINNIARVLICSRLTAESKTLPKFFLVRGIGMSSPVSQEQPARSKAFVADSLAVGMLVMLGMTVIQRGVGFFRSIWFCRLMDDHVLGQWSMAYLFLINVTPIMLFGMSGSLPRYVEHYRQRGHLQEFVKRILWATVGCGLAFFAIMLAFQETFAWLIFLDESKTSLIFCVALAAGSTIAFLFVNELVSSLRQVRVSSIMYFMQSIGFTLIGITWLYFGGEVNSLVLSYVIATAIAVLPGLYVLNSGWRDLEKSDAQFQPRPMWRKLLPYATSIWLMNLLMNAFDFSDRYMILHWMPGGELAGQSAVGQYHSGRIFAVLLLSLATMITGVLMPYLSADWEAGKRKNVSDRLRRWLFFVSTVSTLGSAVVLMISPWLFSTVLQDRYTEGLSLMPMAFLMCIWSAVTAIAQCYLFVVEKGNRVAWVFGSGLIVNIALNGLMLPMYGLQGAVIATVISNGLVMLGVWLTMWHEGFKLDSTTFYVSLLPAALIANPLLAILFTLLAFAANSHARQWIPEGAKVVSQKLART